MTDKRDELVGNVQAALRRVYGGTQEALAGELVDAFTEIEPPKIIIRGEPGQVMTRSMSMRHGGVEGARSRKPGNVVVDAGSLIFASAGGVLTALSLSAGSVLAYPLGFVVIWGALSGCADVVLDEVTASVIWSMHQQADEKVIGHEGLLECVNQERLLHHLRPIDPQRLRSAVRELERIRCIKLLEGEPRRWRLIERLKVDYL